MRTIEISFTIPSCNLFKQIASEKRAKNTLMDILLSIIAIIFLLLGLVGAILPILPGPALSFLGLLSLYFATYEPFTDKFLFIWLLITIAVTIIDQVVPVIGTKRMGGSKYGVWGSIIGLIIGIFFFPPLGIIIGPFLGAVGGELVYGKHTSVALKSGLGSLIGFLGGTFMKLVFSVIAAYYILANLSFWHW